MWKTRFEVNTSNHISLKYHREHISSSTTIHQYNPWSISPLASVRDDLPVRSIDPLLSSYTPNLEILPEEDENIPHTNLTNNHQLCSPSILLRKKKLHATSIKHQNILPTIIESHDHEFIADHLSNNNHINFTTKDSINNENNTLIVGSKSKDSCLGTNTNYSEIKHTDIANEQRTFNTNTNYDAIELPFDKRLNEILQQNSPKFNKVCDIVLVFARSNF